MSRFWANWGGILFLVAWIGIGVIWAITSKQGAPDCTQQGQWGC